MASRNDHTRAEELFSAYIDQRTTADERIFVERHVAACADCRAKLQATRSMIAALKTMPPVRAPRSFVLPKEMAKQPKRSVFAWYPVLRLATVTAIAAFAIVFASDVLTPRGQSVSSVTMSAPAPAAEQQAPAAAPQAPAAPTAAPQLSMKAAQPTAAPTMSAPTATAVADQPPAAAVPAPAGGVAATVQLTETPQPDTGNTAVMAQPAPSDTLTLSTTSAYAPLAATTEATPAPETTAADQLGPQPTPQPERAAVPTPAAVDPLRIATIALGGLAALLLVATLIARRNA